ncbi:ParB/RepB/Spo0J family partition protein [Deinococcus grandis]|uniref:ParB/RepB/Spo0J family partition protein n=1 Tax=Deinococcus grandis TaxID=57498 RepID=UPI00073F5EED|nr:ParB/RepB/Spo0J family partition protein [Deinococcus grandis]
MTFRSGQTVTGMSLSGPVTGTVLRVRPSIIDRSVLIVDLDVDGVEHNVPAEDCTLVRPDRPVTQEDPVTTELPAQIKVKQTRKAARENPVADQDGTPAPAVPPGTPALLSSADLTPGTLGLHAVPLGQTARSGCNVRSHYDPAAIEELAASLKAEGQIENATGRWNADGQVEIVAGESRRRAQLLRQENGETALTLLVNIRDLTDAEALSISATENMRRRSMTALEECEAMQRLNAAGRSIEEIQAMFGFKTAQPVADRILVAKNLLTATREALDNGQVSLASAMVIARATGAQLQQELLNWAQRGHSAKKLGELLTDGQFLVEHARFNVEKSGLAVRRDLFDAFPPYFEDKNGALQKQLEWANAQAEKARAKGKHQFVAVETGTSLWGSLDSNKKYEYSYTAPTGLIYFVNTSSGKVETSEKYRLKASAKAAAVATGQAAPDAPVRAMPESAFLEAHHYRARALRESLLGHPHLGLILAVHGLIMGGSANGSEGRTGVRLSTEVPVAEPALIPTLLAERLDQLQARVQGIPNRGVDAASTVRVGHLRGGVEADSVKLFERLATWTQTELLDALNTLTAAVTYDWVHYSMAEHPAAPLYSILAAQTGANTALARDFKLTDEWLKRYPRHELIALAEEAGLGRALVEDCSTLKEMRARILEHADALHREGFVPRIVQFPAVQQDRGTQ